MKGCFTVVGAVVALVFLAAMCSSSPNVTTPSGDAWHNSSSSSSVSTTSDNSTNDCNSSVTHTNQAWKDYNAGDYDGGYKNANTAVSLADSCNQGGDYDSAKGFALSARALNEHHLSQGDSRTDLNQAEQLLSSCQSDVGYYGTHAAAVCETQEQNDISAETNWEMSQ